MYPLTSVFVSGAYADVVALSRRGRSVTSLGVLYDFTGNDEGTIVQKVADMVKESWVCIR